MSDLTWSQKRLVLKLIYIMTPENPIIRISSLGESEKEGTLSVKNVLAQNFIGKNFVLNNRHL